MTKTEIKVLQRALEHRQTEMRNAARNREALAIETSPDVPEAHYLMAQVYKELNDAQGSEKEFAEFQRLSKVGGEKTPGDNPQN